MRSFPWAALAYPTLGAAAGAVVGLVVSSPAQALETAAPWAILVGAAGAVGLGGWAGIRALRRRRPKPAAVRVDATGGSGPRVAIELPALERGFPDVWGAGDDLEVVVRASAGSAVALATEPAGDVRALGGGRFAVRAAAGAVVLVARARAAEAESEARRTVRFVRYDREIQTMVDDFRAWSEANLPAARHALTARELMEAVAPRAGDEGGRALLVLARAYEIVTYGERPADRALYAEVVRAFAALERSGVFEAAPAPEAP